MSSQGGIRPLPIDFENLPFEVLEEHWNTYELQNHTMVRGRVIVTRFGKDPHDPNATAYNVATQNVFVVDAPVEQRGQPTLPLTQEEIRNIRGTPATILTNNEVWNRYRIISTGMILKVKLVVDDAIRIENRFDNDGMPQYVFHSSPMVIPDRHANTNFRT